jgi:hypothetical protein
MEQVKRELRCANNKEKGVIHGGKNENIADTAYRYVVHNPGTGMGSFQAG